MKLYRVLDDRNEITFAAEIDGAMRRIDGDVLGAYRVTGEPVDVRKTLPPIDPPNIFAIGKNYREHAREMRSDAPDAPIVFAKATTSLTAPGDPIVLPKVGADRVDYEAELAVVIGRRCRDVPVGKALDVVLGYTVANDVSARDWQKRLVQWVRAKSFDTFCPLGPCIETDLDPTDVRVRCELNGAVMQDGTTADMIFSVVELIAFLSSDLTLEPGTLLLTGTPEGVGVARDPQVFLAPGDTVTCAVEGIGSLTNPVTEAARTAEAGG